MYMELRILYTHMYKCVYMFPFLWCLYWPLVHDDTFEHVNYMLTIRQIQSWHWDFTLGNSVSPKIMNTSSLDRSYETLCILLE